MPRLCRGRGGGKAPSGSKRSLRALLEELAATVEDRGASRSNGARTNGTRQHKR